ncbi:hypothetical protein, partial [uncultured Limnohabitans sp.]|uniref:hypothetical protein n=1 Tax=uncultured Limnohabitans sp. TaxID=768543 RepID=UPI002623A626
MLQGALWQSLALTAWGVLVIGLVDNMLRPMLVEALHANGYRVMTVENNIELLAATKRVGARCILILNQASVSGSLREVLESIQAE